MRNATTKTAKSVLTNWAVLAPDLVVHVDQYGSILEANPIALQILEAADGARLEGPIRDWIREPDRPAWDDAFAGCLVGRGARLDAVGVRSKDNSLRWMSFSLCPVEGPAKSAVTQTLSKQKGRPHADSVLILGRDVSELVERLRCAEEADTWMRAVLASSLDPLITISSAGIIRSASDSVERVFGWLPSELVGRNVSLLMPEPTRSEHDGHLAKFRATGQTWILGNTRRLEAVRKNGEVFPCEISVSRVDLPGQPEPHFVGTVRDITRRAIAERDRQNLTLRLEAKNRQLEAFAFNAEKLASLGKLAASVAHEIRNPLTSIRVRLYSIQKAIGANPKLDERFQAIADEITHLDNVVRNFLEFSRIPALELRQCTVADLVGKTLDLFRHHLQKAGIEVVQGDLSLLPPVRTDAEQMRQVFINLLANAVDAMPSGGTIRVEGSVETCDGRPMVAVRFADSGPGISAELADRVFEPFFSTKSEGTGLGLCISSRIAEHHGGSLSLESPGSGGAVFVVRIPAMGTASHEPDPGCR